MQNIRYGTGIRFKEQLNMYCWAMYLIQDSVFVTKILSNVSQEINQFTLTKGKYKITRGNFHFSVVEVH